MKFKAMSDIDLYDYLWQSGVEGCDIPRKRKSRIVMCGTMFEKFRIPAVRERAYAIK